MTTRCGGRGCTRRRTAGAPRRAGSRVSTGGSGSPSRRRPRRPGAARSAAAGRASRPPGPGRPRPRLPLEALGPVGGQQPDGLAADPALGSVSAGSSLGLSVSRNAATPARPALLLGLGGLLEERAHGVEVAVRPPPARSRRAGGPSAVCRSRWPSHRAARAPPRRRLLVEPRRAPARTAANRRALSTSGPRRGLEDGGVDTASRTSSARLGRGPPARRSVPSRGGAARLRPAAPSAASRPPAGTAAGSRPSPASRTPGRARRGRGGPRSASSSGWTAGSLTSGVSSAATSTGTPAAVSARRSSGDRGATAADEDGHLRPRRRRPGGAPGGAGRRRARPRPGPSRGGAPRPLPGPWRAGFATAPRNASKAAVGIAPRTGIPVATRSEAAFSAGPNRRVRVRASTGARRPSSRGKSRRGSRGSRARPRPRNP